MRRSVTPAVAALTISLSRTNLAGWATRGRLIFPRNGSAPLRFTSLSRLAAPRVARSPRWLLLAMGLVLFAVPPRSLPAQAVAGIGDDAIPLPRKGWRLLLGGLWNDYTVYEPGVGRQPLLGGLASNAAGVAQFPTILPAVQGLRTLTGDPRMVLSLGTLETNGAVRQSIAPFTVDYGFSRRLSFRAVVPYVESRDATQLLLNRTGTGANVGVNPGFGSTGSTARATNGALLTQIDAARSALAAEVTRCTSPTATNCAAIRANPDGIQLLLTRALATRDALAQVYGTGRGGGAPVVPLAGSSLDTAVRTGLSALRSDFTAYGISAISESAQPVAATTIMGPGAGITRIATDTAFGLGYQYVGNTRRAGIGDVDLTATWLLVDHFGADQTRRLLEPTRGFRSTITGGWRFGLAGADRTDDPFDVPIGDGANALLLRSTTDFIWSRRLWISGTLRAAKPLADQVAVAWPTTGDVGIFAPFAVRSASRSLGLRYDLELAPRLSVGQFFGLSGAFLLRRWGQDRLQLSDGAVTELVPSTLDTPARTLRAVAVGASFSTLASYVRGRSRFPAEVIYTHTEPIGGSGGAVPAIASERLELRIYTGFPRR
jgi:hypothetical protein